jgi:hypothetical protein
MEALAAVPSHATVWILDEGVWVTLDDDEIAERLSQPDRGRLNLLRDLVRDFRTWEVQVTIDDQVFKLTWGSDGPDDVEQSPR